MAGQRQLAAATQGEALTAAMTGLTLASSRPTTRCPKRDTSSASRAPSAASSAMSAPATKLSPLPPSHQGTLGVVRGEGQGERLDLSNVSRFRALSLSGGSPSAR